MAEYSIVFARSARKDLERLDARTVQRIFPKIEKLATLPRPAGCLKLQGSGDLWRVRVGDYRVIYAIHDRAMAMLRELLSRDHVDWEDLLAFSTHDGGVLRATRRTVFVHLLTHSIRHHAQLATAVRHGGVRADWEMDYLFMGVQ